MIAMASVQSESLMRRSHHPLDVTVRTGLDCCGGCNRARLARSCSARSARSSPNTPKRRNACSSCTRTCRRYVPDTADLRAPEHPYTQALLAALVAHATAHVLKAIPASFWPADGRSVPAHPRCDTSVERCRMERPSLAGPSCRQARCIFPRCGRAPTRGWRRSRRRAGRRVTMTLPARLEASSLTRHYTCREAFRPKGLVRASTAFRLGHEGRRSLCREPGAQSTLARAVTMIESDAGELRIPWRMWCRPRRRR